jgi:hypothetical protein
VFNLDNPLDRVRLTRDLYNLVDIIKKEGPADEPSELRDYKKAMTKARQAGMKTLTKRGPGDEECDDDASGEYILELVVRHIFTIKQRDKVRVTQRTASSC